MGEVMDDLIERLRAAATVYDKRQTVPRQILRPLLREAADALENPPRPACCHEMQTFYDARSAHQRAAARLDEAESLLRDVIASSEADRPRYGNPNNSPGHCHRQPPAWDGSGRWCAQCAAWIAARAFLSELAGETNQ